MERYNLLYHNCNSFTRKICKTLVGIRYLDKYPNWINRGEKMIKWIYATSCAPMLTFMPQVLGFYRDGYGNIESTYLENGDNNYEIESIDDDNNIESREA